MATYYSDHFSGFHPETGEVSNAYLSKTKYPSEGIGGGNIRYARAEVTVDAASTDVVRMMQLRSNDRIFQIFLTSPDSGSAGNLQIGMYKSGVSHDGPVVDANIFGVGYIKDFAYEHVDRFGVEGAPDLDYFRGKPLWECATQAGSESAGEYTTNPAEDWDLTLRYHEGTSVSTQIVIEVLYTSGG